MVETTPHIDEEEAPEAEAGPSVLTRLFGVSALGPFIALVLVCAFFATVMGFALIWHIWWMVGLGLVAAYAVFVWFAWRDVAEYSIPADEVARLDRTRRQARAQWLAQHARAGVPA